MQISLENPFNNIIKIGGDEFVLAYVDNKNPKNKGGNSIVLTIHEKSLFEEKEYAYDEPSGVIKIERSPQSRWNRSPRFELEVSALQKCKDHGFQNIIEIGNFGSCEIPTLDKGEIKGCKYDYYTMEFAEYDLKKYIEEKNLSLYEKVNLCLEISNGISELKTLGYYHRDLKPDNILISSDRWKIADLGLIDNQNFEDSFDKEGSLIGPRGWYSPEALNKYLTENKNIIYAYDCMIDHQSDIFQLGKLFWYICQGNCPVGTVKPDDFRIQHTQLYSIIKTMLNHNKRKRYKNINEVIDLLKPIHRKLFAFN